MSYHRQCMAKFRPAKKKSKGTPAPAAGVPCMILLIAGFVLVMLFMYFVMRYSNA